MTCDRETELEWRITDCSSMSNVSSCGPCTGVIKVHDITLSQLDYINVKTDIILDLLSIT